jgi:hypothetical protein
MQNLSRVIHDLQQESKRLRSQLTGIEGAIAALKGLTTKNGATRTARTMSAAARKRIAAAQRARWAKWKKANKSAKSA